MTKTMFLLGRLAKGGLAVMALSVLTGCMMVTDTSRMNIETFQDDIAPIYYDPVRNQPNEIQTRPPGRALYQNQLYKRETSQSYGLPVARPLDRVLYDSIRDEGFTLPAIPISRVDPQYLRQEVAYQTTEKPGTIVVDTNERFLYLVQPNGRAMRYGVGIGREAVAWKGRGVIQRKAKWPRWTPTDEMVSRQPNLRPYSIAEGGLEGGRNNPLGARALYIFAGGEDTLYRVHGTPDWQSVGKAVSSGCVRMFNQDVIDLYDRVGDKAEIVVL